MPEIRTVREGAHEGKDGFIVEWEMIGFAERVARFRAVLMTALRFPTTITEVSIVGVRDLGHRDKNVMVFVPTEGFPSAGLEQPVKWAKEEFRERFIE